MVDNIKGFKGDSRKEAEFSPVNGMKVFEIGLELQGNGQRHPSQDPRRPPSSGAELTTLLTGTQTRILTGFRFPSAAWNFIPHSEQQKQS